MLNYPTTKEVDTVDTYFGTEVKDPYRWLEDDLSEETAQWVTSQNQVTFGYLDNIPYRDQLKERLETLWNYERITEPRKKKEIISIILKIMAFRTSLFYIDPRKMKSLRFF